MSCFFYNANQTCTGCANFIKSSSIVLDDDFLVITIPEDIVLKNHQKICLCLVQAIPEDITANTKVIVHIGEEDLEKLTVITRRGNYLYADVLKSRMVYPLYTATDMKALVLCDMNKIKATNHIFSAVPAPK